MRILIVEDEPTIAKRIERLTSEILGERLANCKILQSLDDADDFIAQHPIDLLFLDLNLQNRDGFELLKQSVAGSFHTIVISANTHRAIDAFEHGVLDFIAKPFTKARIEKALARYGTNNRSNESTVNQLKYLTIQQSGSLSLISVDDILFIEGASNYSEIHLISGGSCLHNKSLSKLCEILPSNFERVHKSYIARMDKAKSLHLKENVNYQIEFINGTSIPVSRTKAKELRNRF